MEGEEGTGFELLARFDLRNCLVRVVRGQDRDHVIIRLGDHLLRLDGAGLLAASKPQPLCFLFRDGAGLHAQLETVRLLHEPDLSQHSAVTQAQFREQLLALWALDRRAAGVSLRRMADDLLGPGEWPGDGEYRKSRIRRLIIKGAAMVQAGPGAILG